MTTFARPADRYSPLYFLASLGAGGTAVTFFLWLYFWIPHPGQSVPVFEDIARALSTGSMLTKGMIFVAMAGIIFFAYLNIRLLIWNLRQLSAFKKTDSYAQLRASNAETQLLAMPLTIAMTINVGFILGMVFVPGLWTVVEYLFPIAIAAFTATGALALVQLGQFLGRVKTDGNFDWTANGSFAQMMPAFALSMVGVGLAAPGALSNVALTSGIGIMLATFFMMAALIVGVVALVLGIHSMLSHGTAVEAVPTILIVIPILTVLGILGMRVNHGLHVNFEDHGTAAQVLMFLTKTYSVQILFALFGIEMLRRVGYAKRFLFGAENSVGAYALVCPAVAFGVMTQFWINAGLVQSGLLTKFSIAYWIVTLVALAAQALAIWLVLHLNRRHFGKAEATPVPAE
ncbi:MAG: hypothetical protein H5U24_03630 [Thioclava marina]|uniref:TsoY family (seleno)protein n=1 Tax=Thioclava TaxID=285107 RepID=UPI0009983C89|nr:MULTISPECIES: hypothetical protein [Thioclava]MBC7144478.1 hypothetical protein [Thioclava marina]OOY29365.1 hypothetical protein BMI90_03715 [Thioclava sp. L04-15]TNE84608.1 MAG: hypothetical protein EP337_13850 [Paracoccaceae bacterium]